ncbi:MAG: DM13 domain-containing protein [Alphaproteobacteria bacterium]
MTRLKNLIRAGFAALAFAFAAPVLVAAPSSAYAAQDAELASGGFTNQEYKISGNWRIYEEDGKTFIALSDDFRTRRGPDLKIFLSPLAPDAVTGKNATEGSLLVAELDKSRGAQTYEIPTGTDLSAYQSVVIHCERFSKLWGAGPLTISD